LNLSIVCKWGVGFQTGLLIPFRCDGILRKKATMKKNYYLVLGVASKAGAKDIEAAFRRRARELHPDTAGLQSGPFLEVQEAYSVLADPERRRHYDRVIHPPPAAQRRPRPKAEPLRPSKAAGSFREVSIGESFASYRPSFDELFDRWWGNFQSVGRPKAETIESLTVEVVIQPEEARWGGRVRAEGGGRLGRINAGAARAMARWPRSIRWKWNTRPGFGMAPRRGFPWLATALRTFSSRCCFASAAAGEKSACSRNRRLPAQVLAARGAAW
jgi:hypothetical protein